MLDPNAPTAATTAALPRWLRPANRVIILLQKLGLPIGTMRVLTIPGRKSGKLHSTPVSPLELDGRTFVIAGVRDGDWARNARVAGQGTLRKGRREWSVRIAEIIDEELKERVLRAFPAKVPHGVGFFVKLGLVEAGTPDAFAAASTAVAVFELIPERTAA